MEALRSNLEEELDFIESVAENNFKNYQIWHHRRWVAQKLGVGAVSGELEFTEIVLLDDAKNYHAWSHRQVVFPYLVPPCTSSYFLSLCTCALPILKLLVITVFCLFFCVCVCLGGVLAEISRLHREYFVIFERCFSRHCSLLTNNVWYPYGWLLGLQWVLQELGGWEGELDFCSRLLEKDVYNNSAWNQRYFVVTKSPLIGGLQAMREHEVHYCVDAIKAAPMNESPWRYLRGLFKGDQDALAHNPLVVAACIEEIRKDASCVQALSLLVDLLGAGFRPTPSDTELLHQPVSSPADLASNVCTHLENVDAMRARYWAWRRSLLPSTTPVS